MISAMQSICLMALFLAYSGAFRDSLNTYLMLPVSSTTFRLLTLARNSYDSFISTEAVMSGSKKSSRA